MESAPEAEKKMNPPEGGSGGGETKSKRKMKTASQLELLEKTYAVETYPSESLRAELSAKLGLTDRQLQMWFCHRRLKDRKVAPVKRARKDSAVPVPAPVAGAGVGLDEMMVGESGNEPGSGSGSGSSPFEARKVVGRVPPAIARIGAEKPMVKRYYEPPPQPLSELRVIAFVEAQLGEPIREDGPILGVEFDPLPPGAFGAPIGITGQQPPIGRTYDSQFYERHDAKSIKTSSLLPSTELGFLPSSSSGKRKVASGSVHMVHSPAAARALHEYQFLPEQPSVRSETYERTDPSHFYSSAIDASSARPSLSTGGAYLHGKELATGYGFPAQVSNISHLSQQGRQVPSVSGDYDSVPHRNTFTNIGLDAPIGTHQLVGLDNPFLSSERRVCHDEDASRMERKRKSEEARIAKEVEAHEKRIRKELERQDILRRKREEQMRREMERHDRERRKEEERLLREKQREEERFQREQRRELERREKFLQKENIRAEKLRQKEELRREKEAARLKAANERATARRIAKESMELIEDERLELMELASLNKGLPSIISLDSETLQNLESFRDMLRMFPPKSVQLKRPFAIQPWTDSEENVGNLLMVWRFLITFADVLELWPFTLDEFVQALHDYDPRLLSEIHVALLRSIIKDIEDVARTPSIGLGANQNSSANPGGGHPQIVEGAYAWGFDIRNWQRHLNTLTWPEILRQFALSAGFGPQLKRRNLERAYMRDDNEGHDGEDIVSTLRNGAAAENAVAVMQEKGFSHPRRSRHRLTPGTVKFAAFHVLSLEGSKGLTILEVADKIQKSGLRDLTTSKTPEASIAAALSRDSNLFERTAPSTYCVRSAFRKDPADAEAILSAAREKIQIFENGFSDSEEAEKDIEDVDDVERDEDSECDVAEDPEVDDVCLTANSVNPDESKTVQVVTCSGNGKRETLHMEVGEARQSEFTNAGKDFSSIVLQASQEVNSSGASIDRPIDAARNCNEPTNTEQEDTEIDESNSGEPWVQGLMEGEYSDLSVEERLNALVALIGVAIEGNSIRVILEERLEAANSLKKQMWAEAQLDKRRLKEDYVPKLQYSYMGIKAEPNLASSAADGNQSPLGVDNKFGDASLDPVGKQEPILDPQNTQSYLNNFPTERNLLGQDFSAGPDNFPQQHGYSAEKSRSQLKSYIGHKAEEMYVYRSLPLGQDRRRNRYWQFVASASRNDPGSSRIFVELQGGFWRLIDSEEAFDNLLASLDTRGVRESHLHSMLQKIETSFREAVKKSSNCTKVIDQSSETVKTEAPEVSYSPDYTAGIESPGHVADDRRCDSLDQSSSFRIELGRSQTEKNNALRRYQDFQKWIWKECFNQSVLCAMKFGKKRCTELLSTCGVCYESYLSEDNHCPVCHGTFGAFYKNSSFSDHVIQCGEKQKRDLDWICHGSNSSLPLRIRMLKAQLALVEVYIPPEALQPCWTEDYRKCWGVKLNDSSSAEELLQLLTIMEGAIKRDYLSSNFETTKELLGSSMPQGSAVGNSSSLPGSVPVLPWVPQTTTAVGLRLMDLDTSIAYILKPKMESLKDKEDNELTRLPSRYTVVKNIPEMGLADAPDQTDYLQEENWLDSGSGRSISGRGRGTRGRSRGGRTRGGRLQRGIRSETGKEIAGSTEKTGKRLGRRSQSRGRGRRRGTRSVRSRPRSVKNVVGKEVHLGRLGVTVVPVPKQNSVGESPRSSGGMEWTNETGRTHVEACENSNSAETLESDDNVQVSGDEYDDPAGYNSIFNDKSEDLNMEESDEDGDEEGGDYNEVDEDGNEEVGVDIEDDGDMDVDLDVDGNLNDDGEGVEEDDGEGIADEEATSSGSSEYSD